MKFCIKFILITSLGCKDNITPQKENSKNTSESIDIDKNNFLPDEEQEKKTERELAAKQAKIEAEQKEQKNIIAEEQAKKEAKQKKNEEKKKKEQQSAEQKKNELLEEKQKEAKKKEKEENEQKKQKNIIAEEQAKLETERKEREQKKNEEKKLAEEQAKLETERKEREKKKNEEKKLAEEQAKKEERELAAKQAKIEAEQNKTEEKQEKKLLNEKGEILSTEEIIEIYENITKDLGKESKWQYIDRLLTEKKEKITDSKKKFTLVVADADGSITRLIIMGIIAEKIVVKKSDEENFKKNLKILIEKENEIIGSKAFDEYQKDEKIYTSIEEIYKTLLFQKSIHVLIFLGDILFDRFTNNLVVSLKLITEMHNVESIFIKGNHDDINNLYIDSKNQGRVQFGCYSQDFDKKKFADNNREYINGFIKSQFVIAHHSVIKNSKGEDRDIVCTHAQILSRKGKDKNSDDWDYYYLFNKKLTGNAIEITKKINDMKNNEEFYNLEKEGYFSDWRVTMVDDPRGKDFYHTSSKKGGANFLKNYGFNQNMSSYNEIINFIHIHGHDLGPKSDIIEDIVCPIEENVTYHLNSMDKCPYAMILYSNFEESSTAA